ncbi:DUF397 domain-containing protein [Streptomyces sp. KM273126]|uniref:DUF397 domain-containing protein n=1 Tax=Streptomyces sp. KM273126 TaxID=2545247 RepID=UPI0015EC35D5|nr:DUF397 domain-containing protein [Streptomyces sp. KM273126]MBA2807592.1 DUF397 domain-containing protein [Streptomyces sp. KM273126]
MPETLHWQKSSFSGGAADTNCLEIAATPTTLHLRESDTPATILAPTPAALTALLAAVRYPQRISNSVATVVKQAQAQAASVQPTQRRRSFR